ncbi:MAG: helix-turn-helix domain-containing protein [Dermatophilaceae bacterium]
MTVVPVGRQLRHWREQRRLSQLELASRAEVSPRHLSCVETGKAQPSAAMIDRLADQLDVPLRSRNGLLMAGGFAPRYGTRGLDDADLAPVLAGIRALIDAHQPYPALLLDDHWNIVDANAAANVFLDRCDPALLEPPVNAIRLSLHPAGLGARLRNRQQWGALLHHRVLHRAERTQDPVLWTLAEEISASIDLPRRPVITADPVLAIELEADGQVLRCYGMVAQLETATDVTLAELHLETFMPADAATQQWLAARG